MTVERYFPLHRAGVCLLCNKTHSQVFADLRRLAAKKALASARNSFSSFKRAISLACSLFCCLSFCTYVAVTLVLEDGTEIRIKRTWKARGKKVDQQTIVEKNGSVDKYLGDNTYVAVTLVLEDGTEIRIKRTWKARGKKVDQQTIVEKNGSVDKYLGDNWSYYIEEILPFGIARFFFFNNEKITQLADDSSFEQIKSSIKSAIGVLTIEKTIEHIDEVIRRKKSALKSFETSELNQEYQEVEREISEIDQRLEDAQRELNKLEL